MGAIILVATFCTFFALVSGISPFGVGNAHFLHPRIDIVYANVSDGNLGLPYRNDLRKRDDCPVTEATNCPSGCIVGVNLVCCALDIGGDACYPGQDCCGTNSCFPVGGSCCMDGTFCDVGLLCATYMGKSTCCTDSKCTALVIDGDTTTLNDSATLMGTKVGQSVATIASSVSASASASASASVSAGAGAQSGQPSKSAAVVAPATSQGAAPTQPQGTPSGDTAQNPAETSTGNAGGDTTGGATGGGNPAAVVTVVTVVNGPVGTDTGAGPHTATLVISQTGPGANGQGGGAVTSTLFIGATPQTTAGSSTAPALASNGVVMTRGVFGKVIGMMVAVTALIVLL